MRKHNPEDLVVVEVNQNTYVYNRHMITKSDMRKVLRKTKPYRNCHFFIHKENNKIISI